MNAELTPAWGHAEAVDPSALECLVIVARQHGIHTTASQLIHDNVLSGDEITSPQLISCATSVGLVAKSIKLNWAGLLQLKKALPAIVKLSNGSSMVLLRLEGDDETRRLVLQDPNASDEALLFIDRIRFEAAWTGEVLLVKRNYEISDESQPFSLGLITALIFRERRIARDIAICAVVLGFMALTPIMFWRLMSDKVIFYKAYNTYAVLCLAMVVLIGFETAFFYLRQSMVHFMTTRLDVKLSTYMFEKVLKSSDRLFRKDSRGPGFPGHAGNFPHPAISGRAVVWDRAGFDDADLLSAGDVLLQPGDDVGGVGIRSRHCRRADAVAAGLPEEIRCRDGGRR